MIQVKEYILKSKDTPLLSFVYRRDTRRSDEKAYSVEVQNIYDVNVHLLPKGLLLSKGDKVFQDDFYDWLTKRKTPVGRTNARKITEFLGDINNPLRYIQITRGLSLNDAFWVVEAGDPATWTACNLYTNPFSELLERIAFEGEILGVKGIANDNKRLQSPEPTTNGMLRKSWYRNSAGEIILRKAEEKDKIKPDGRSVVLMEYYAMQLAEAMGLPHVKYSLANYARKTGTGWKEDIVCECPLFTSEDIGFVPSEALLHEWYSELTNHILDTKEFHKEFAGMFGFDFYSDMMIYDALILNLDRHLGNFGYLIDNNTGEYLDPAPLFDNGNSLLATSFHNMTESYVSMVLNHPLIQQRGKFLTYKDAIDTFAGQRHKSLPQELKSFSFKQPDNPKLQIPTESLKAMDAAVRIQLEKIRESLEKDHIENQYILDNSCYDDWGDR